MSVDYGVVTSVASIESLISDDFTTCVTGFFDTFVDFINFVTNEPLLMFGLSFAAVAGLTGLIFRASRRLGFKSRR